VVTKTLIDIDDDLLEAAREALGTTTKKDTVNTVLREVLAAQQRRRAVDDLIAWGQRNEPWDDSLRDRAWRRTR
jgi:Arc/MetJ family transcription regulator